MRLTIDRTALSPRYEALLSAWGYVQHELLYLSWAIMDAALLTPLALGIMRFARYWQPGLVLLWLLILMLFAFYLARSDERPPAAAAAPTDGNGPHPVPGHCGDPAYLFP